MWWLSFLGGGVAIMEATSLAQARLLAVVNGLGRASQFVEGYSINPDLAALIPDGSIATCQSITGRRPQELARQLPPRGLAG